MKAASANLVPVTLELGGKSPVVVEKGFSLERAAASIAFGKLANGGQICVAPDYALVPEKDVEAVRRGLRQGGARALSRGARRATISPPSSTSGTTAGCARCSTTPAPRARASSRSAPTRRQREAARTRWRRPWFSALPMTWASSTRRSSDRCCRSCPTGRSTRRSPTSMRDRGRWHSTISAATARIAARCLSARRRAT